MEIGYYIVKGLHTDGYTLEEKIKGEEAKISSVAVGEWTITVEVWNTEEPAIKIGEGSLPEPVLIEVGKITNADVTVYPLEGNGKLSIYLSWPAEAVQAPVVGVTLEDLSFNEAATYEGNPVEIAFGINQGEGTATSIGDTVKAGYYTLTLWF